MALCHVYPLYGAGTEVGTPSSLSFSLSLSLSLSPSLPVSLSSLYRSRFSLYFFLSLSLCYYPMNSLLPDSAHRDRNVLVPVYQPSDPWLILMPHILPHPGLQILFTDTDTFQHASSLTYVRFCQRTLRQAVTECARAGKSPRPHQAGDQSNFWPRKITPDVMKRGVKTARCRYFRECMMGDQVRVHLWEDQDKPFWVFFSVEMDGCGGNSLRFQMSMEYFHDKWLPLTCVPYIPWEIWSRSNAPPEYPVLAWPSRFIQLHSSRLELLFHTAMPRLPRLLSSSYKTWLVVYHNCCDMYWHTTLC